MKNFLIIMMAFTVNVSLFAAAPEIKRKEAKYAAERKASVPQKPEQLRDKFWGTTNIKPVWDGVQALLKQRTTREEEAFEQEEGAFSDEEYAQLETLRDEQAPKVSPKLPQLLEIYLPLWEQLSGATRDQLFTLMDAIMSALLGDQQLSLEEYNVVKKVIKDIQALSPDNPRLISLLTNMIEAKKPVTEQENKLAACLKKLRKKYVDLMQDQQAALLAQFYEYTGVDEQKLNEHVELNKDLIMHDLKKRIASQREDQIFSDPISAPLYKKAQELMPRVGIDPSTITILETKGYYLTPNRSFLIYNPTAVEKLSPELIELFLLHELYHVGFNDGMQERAMENLLHYQAPEHKDSFMELWKAFKVKNADIYAYTTHINGISPLKRIQSQIQYLKKDNRADSPARLALAEKIYREMQDCYK